MLVVFYRKHHAVENCQVFAVEIRLRTITIGGVLPRPDRIEIVLMLKRPLKKFVFRFACLFETDGTDRALFLRRIDDVV